MLLLLLHLSFGLLAQAHGVPYELMQPENHEYRDYTAQELRTLLAADASHISSYQCNQERENAIFTTATIENSNADSLQIKDASGNKFIYQKGRYSKFQTFEDPFVRQALDALDTLERFPSSARLLRELEKSQFPLFLAKGTSRFDPREEDGRPNFGMQQSQAIVYFVTLRKADNPMPFKRIGSGGYVRWNPKETSPLLEADGVMRSVPAYIALAHEMYHAYDSIRGVLDMRFVYGEGYEHQAVVEFRGVYFENQIRAEAGLQYRKRYSSSEGPLETGNMIDANGRPIAIPSACI